MLLQEIRRLVRDIQVNAIQPAFLHFKVDRAGDDITRRKLRARVVPGHETGPIGEFQHAAFSAHRLADEKRLGMRMIKTGGMKLDEFHVRDAATRPPSHGDAVAGGGIGIGCVEIYFARAARRQHGIIRPDGPDLAGGAIQHIGAIAAVALLLGDPPEGSPTWRW